MQMRGSTAPDPKSAYDKSGIHSWAAPGCSKSLLRVFVGMDEKLSKRFGCFVFHLEHIGVKYFIQFPLLWRKVSSSPLLLSSGDSLKFAGQVRSLLSRSMTCTDPLASALANHLAHCVQV